MIDESEYNIDDDKHRRSIRLKGYDYSRDGAYFITICAQDNKCIFGEIVNGKMILNEAGKMVERCYLALEEQFPDARCKNYVIMPNHFHCILRIDRHGEYDANEADEFIKTHEFAGQPQGIAKIDGDAAGDDGGNHKGIAPTEDVQLRGIARTGGPCGYPGVDDAEGDGGNHKGIAPTEGEQPRGIARTDVPQLVHWFKTVTTNEYIQMVKRGEAPAFRKRVWLRNYFEHIIRNENEYHKIVEYIQNNPITWGIKKDKIF